MSKNILLSVLFVVLSIVSFSFAQSACTDGETMCDPSNPNYMWECVNGTWENQVYCPDGCNYATNLCNGMTNGDSCTNEGETRCDPNDSDSVQRCENDGTGTLEWRFYMSCNGRFCNYFTNMCNPGLPPILQNCSPAPFSLVPGKNNDEYCSLLEPRSYFTCDGYSGMWQGDLCPQGTVCEHTSATSVQCVLQENLPAVCPTLPDHFYIGLYTSGNQVCDFNNVGGYLECTESGTWVSKTCAPLDLCTVISPTSIMCEQSQTNNTNDTPLCLVGSQRCNQNMIETCVNVSGSVGYYATIACASDEYCVELGTYPQSAICQRRSSPYTGGSSSFSSSGVGSGGAIFWDRVGTACSSYSDWEMVSSVQITDSINNGCVNITLERYCVLSDGTLDKSRKETSYELDCSTQEKCDYLYDRTEYYTDNSSNGLCRTCTREVYVYSCYPSGTVDKTKVRESVSCGNYEKCEAKFPTASATQTDFFGFDMLTMFALLLLFLLVILLFFLFGKKKSDEDEQHEDGQTGNEQNQF